MVLGPAIRVGAVLAAAATLTACGEAPRAADPEPDPTVAPLPEGGGEISGSRIDPLFGDAADAITEGRFSYEVRCWAPDEWRDVMAYWGGDLGGPASGFMLGLSDMQLSPEVCTPLTEFAYGPPGARKETPSDETTWALMVFTHEIGHSIIGRSEAATECWALQRAAIVAGVLGASERTASAAGQIYFKRFYPRLPAEYRSDECHEDGPFDETPGDGSWP